jgi:hypothetical protein
MSNSFSKRQKRTILWLALPILFAWVWAGCVSLVHHFSYTGVAVGEVVHLQQSRTGRVAPVIRYDAQNGNPYKFRSAVYVGQGAYVEGQKLTIRYHPDHPEDASIPGFMQNHAGALVFTILWGFLSLVYYLLIFYSDKRP